MKKALALICVIVCLLALAGCIPKSYEVTITCDNVAVGSTIDDVTVSVLLNGKEHNISNVYWSVMGEDAMEPLSAGDSFELGKYYQMYLYYPIEKGMTSETVTVTLNSENGEHLYTQETEIKEDGTQEMMSLIGFDFAADSVLDITCENTILGCTPEDVSIDIKYNGESLDPVKVGWSVMGETAMDPIDDATPFEAGKYYQLYLYYPLMDGMSAETMAVNFTGENGEHMYVENEEVDGVPVMISLIGFDFTNVPVLELSCENVVIGNTPADAVIGIKYNGVSIEPTMIGWSVMGETAMDPIDDTTPFEAGKYYQLYVHYPIAEGMDSANMGVNFTGENGEHLYTQESNGESGNPDMLSLVGFDFINAHGVEITCENATLGNTPGDVKIGLKYDGEPIKPSLISWSIMGEDAFESIGNDVQFLGGHYYQMYLYYTVDPGVTAEMLGVRLVSETGEHVYTNPIETENGDNKMMSLIGFDYTALEDTHKHEWKKDPDQQTIKASCTQEGKEFFICEVCGQNKTNILPKTEHKYGNGKYIGGSCDDGLFYHYECKNCKTIKEERKEPSGKHNWEKNPDIEWIKPTCEETGAEYFRCTICRQGKTNLLPMTNHEYDGGKVVGGSCANGLIYRYECKNCGATKEETKAPEGKHKYKQDPDNRSIAATCEKDGKEYLKCTVCGEKTSSVIPQTGHDFATDHIASGDCVSGMIVVEKCRNCGATREKSVTMRKHTWLSGGEYWNNHTHVRTCGICGITTREDHSLDNRGHCSVCDSYIVN